MINLRDYNNQEEIITLLAECMYPDVERVKREYERYRNDQNRILLGRIEGKNLVGIIGVIWLTENEVELKHISIKASKRRQGLGKKLIYEFIKENQIKRIEVETDKNSVNFYKKIGFKITSLGEKYVVDFILT